MAKVEVPVEEIVAQPKALITEEKAPRPAVKTVFNQSKVTNSDIYAELKPMPYKIQTNAEEVADKCELCLELPCCPEHCCDVSSMLVKLAFKILTLIFY